MRRHLIAVFLFALVFLWGISPASAQVEPGTWEFEIYFGSYKPGVDALDSDATWGFRGGLNLTSRFSLSGTVGFFTTDEDFSEGSITGNANLEATLIDLKRSPDSSLQCDLSLPADPVALFH